MDGMPPPTTPNPGASLWNASPKFTFLFGLSIGVAVFALIGFFALLARTEGGLTTKSSSKTNSTTGTTTNTSGSASGSKSGQAAGTAKVSVPVTDADWSRGAKDAKVTIVEFSDIQCPFCGRFHPTMQQIIKDYDGKVRWVYKHFPLDSIHPNARPAAEAAECAGEQGKFWEFVDTMFADQSKLGSSYYSQVAKDLGLNTSQFDSCVSSGKYKQKVEDQYQEGVKLGVGGTPTSFANGQPINGALPYEQVKQIVDSQLAS